MVAVISRRKIARSRFATGPGQAWKYIYDVTLDGREVVSGVDMLATATRLAREAARPQRPAIIRTWETISQSTPSSRGE